MAVGAGYMRLKTRCGTYVPREDQIIELRNELLGVIEDTNVYKVQ